MSTSGSAPARRRAIVVGGGIAGLLAARVLTRHFERVTILDRDLLPAGPDPRAGAPQSHHVHVLLTRGWRIMSELFPDLGPALAAAGAHEIDWLDDVAWHTPFGEAPRVPSQLRSRACTRGLLEYLAREALIADARVRVHSGVEVTGLQAQGERIVGVQVHRRSGAPELADDDLRADLVVDASGRASKAPTWLAALGYPEPPETVIDAQLGYATRLYELTARPDWKVLYAMGKPGKNPRGGVVYPVEGGRHIVTLVGYGGTFPPVDEAGFLEFAGALETPALRDALVGAVPCSAIHGYRKTENRLRHYEKLRRWPAGLVVLGDAACALNPVYGQGMSVAAVAATVLDAALRARPEQPLGLRFQKRLAAGNLAAFMTASSDDLRWPGTTGKVSPGLKLMHRLVDRIFAAATRSPEIHLRLVEVLHLMRPSHALFHPSVLRRALLRR
ncbi:NAD(P)/FAD-dependent oxidoreductase [Nannocystis bainbridge]|uniref:FAD-dependent monooxygenase n=1 Tax=Nannocystis bainbridge TaxID=2995303 RepID=A0ABT5E3B7_9BACT|nr:FAD-dependent monooxygenase [Nannocystis bainbridge]MDC0719221.1 FAD-dependent monooxygenase [Nannocystis bainbridge]